MSVLDLIKRNRSYRRFNQSKLIELPQLESMVEAARLSASSRNIQPLKFHISNCPELNSKIFPTLAWAGYLTGWDGPKEGERPTGYITILHDKKITNTYSCDHGIMAQSMLLQAVELGYGGCIIASVKREELNKILNLEDHLEIVLVIALGEPVEKVVIDNLKDNDYKYWREEDGTHHVPKRELNDLIIR